MNAKRISGIICILIGIVLLCLGFYGKHRMEEAREQIASARAPSGIIPKNPITDPIQKDITEGIKEKYYRQVDQYELPVMLLFIGGGVFIVIGIFLLSFGRPKKN
ncbi:MAG: hypothetical protein K940chlam6_00762 [Chlamydiae bacterium]|nr:hypothetical protein [Chlamydiota bacterium]